MPSERVVGLERGPLMRVASEASFAAGAHTFASLQRTAAAAVQGDCDFRDGRNPCGLMNPEAWR